MFTGQASGFCILKPFVFYVLTTAYHVYIICDKAMKVRMLHCEFKWEIPIYKPVMIRDTVEYPWRQKGDRCGLWQSGAGAPKAQRLFSAGMF